MRVAVTEVSIYAGPAYMVNTEDGPMATCDFYAAAIGADGQEYIHLVPHDRRHAAQRLVDRVTAAGVIDTDHWHQPERTSLEERFAMYAEAEAEMRMGHRPENDYHGIPHRR